METLVIIFIIALFVFSVIIHEVSHGIMAYRFGDDTAYLKGRITLDPIKHIDLFWTIILPLVMYFSSGIIFGGAKPVPVNPLRLRHPRKDMIWVSAAGPGSNLLLALIFAIVYHFARLIPSGSLLSNLTNILLLGLPVVVLVNIFLAFFNLIPVPPLDGGRILVGLLPREMAYKFASIERYGMLILVGLLVTGMIRLVFEPARMLSNLLLMQPYF